MRSQQELEKICSKFQIYRDYLVAVPLGAGHINDTYQVTYDQGGIRLHYTLQRINHEIFTNPHELMDNIDRVTKHLLHKIRERDAVTKQRTVRLLRTTNDLTYVRDDKGNYWRMYIFVEHARSYEILETEQQAYHIAKAFSQFQRDLTDLEGDRLYVTIPDFHNTPKRVEYFENVLKNDPYDRAKNVQREIDFALSLKDEAATLIKLQESGDIPERITHNDTKSNNILVDDLTGEGVCVIDLDTVIPGLALYDFGDMLRSGTCPAAEDEISLEQVYMQFHMYEALLHGYLDGSDGFLTPAEIEYLPFSGKLITFEIGLRFLTDYLNGDKYFKTARPNHNLDRCRNQFKLVQSMTDQMDRMKSLLCNY